jgi:hypothetical protein
VFIFFSYDYAPPESQDYHHAIAKDEKEAGELTETGFQYVTEIEGTKLFKKRK